MNIKYKDLSVIGKIWTLTEMLYSGIKDVKQSYLLAVKRKLEELNDSEEIKTSNTLNEHTIDNIIYNSKSLANYCLGIQEEEDYIEDDTMLLNIWFLKVQADAIKRRAKEKILFAHDKEVLDNIIYKIKNYWLIAGYKEKVLTGKEKRDLHKIYLELSSLQQKINNEQVDYKIIEDNL